MRLAAPLREHRPSAPPSTHALAAPTCLHAARLHFRAALGRARTEAEQRFLEKRLLACKSA